eukprot:COSAG05_NODE_229_length_13378_cov_4.728594_2_plen_101_part_00
MDELLGPAQLGDLAVVALAAAVVAVVPVADAPGGKLHDAEREVRACDATTGLRERPIQASTCLQTKYWYTHASRHATRRERGGGGGGGEGGPKWEKQRFP